MKAANPFLIPPSTFSRVLAGFSFLLLAASPGFSTPPVANDDSAIVPEGGTITTLDTGADNLLANDTDAENDPLTVNTAPVNGPSHGTLTLATDGTLAPFPTLMTDSPSRWTALFTKSLTGPPRTRPPSP